MNAQDILKYGHLTVVGTLEGVPDVEWETPDVCGVWSVKEIIAHLASFEQVLVEVLAHFLTGAPTPTITLWTQDPAIFNDDQVALRGAQSPQETLAEYTMIQARVMELAAEIPPGRFTEVGTLPWYGPEYALDDFIVYNFYGHKREHCAQINVFKDQLRVRQ